jgi:hypothetical protein
VPFCYVTSSEAQTQSTGYQTSASGNTELDVCSLKAGAAGRATTWYKTQAGGRGSQLTALTGIRLNIKLFTTATTTGTSITAQPTNSVYQASKGVWLIGSSGVNVVSGGSGGPTYRGGLNLGASGPGGWVASQPDEAYVLEAGYAGSLDLWSIATPAVSFAYDFDIFSSEG